MTATPRPILYVHHRPELGGAPTSLSYLIRKLDRDRFEPHVYCPPGPAADAFRESGAFVHEGPVATFTHIWASTYTGRRWLLFARELTTARRHVRGLQATLRGGRFGLVHLNDSPLVPAALVAHRAGLPIVWHLRSALPGTGTDLRSRLIRRVIRRLAAVAVAINDDVARSFDVDAVVVSNSVDLEVFRPADPAVAKEELGIDAATPVVSYFGFIYPSKGFREFIEAARLLRRRGIDAAYLIVGGPVRREDFFRTRLGRALKLVGLARDYQSEAENLVAELDLRDRVHFVPFTSETTRLFHASDIVVAPSRGPELGRPVLEASACGRAVVASGSIDGAGILLPDVTGRLVPRRSPDSLAAALGELLTNDELRLRFGENARRHSEQKFDAGLAAEGVMRLYDGILARST